MPNFDGTDPLKRGTVIGRGLGSCGRRDEGCKRHSPDTDQMVGKNTRLTTYKE